jgi:hypothetical protein
MTEKRAFSRRVMIKQSALLAGAAVLPPALPRYTLSSDKSSGASTMSSSPFGFWRIQESLPEFVYTANQQTLAEALWDPIDRPHSRRHFHMMGNRAIQMQVSNTGGRRRSRESSWPNLFWRQCQSPGSASAAHGALP